MSLYKRERSAMWWTLFRVNGQRIRLSTGTTNRDQAAEFEAAARSAAWRQAKLGERPPYPWKDARKRWLAETVKRTIEKDKLILAWFDQHLADATLQGITREVVEELRALKAEESSQSTADRYMALLRAILRKAVDDWQVLASAPKVPMYHPRVAEPVWLTREQFTELAAELPEHLALAAECAVLTGLRMRSMLGLTWDRVDLEQRRAWVPRANMKAGATFGLPLSPRAVAVLRKCRKLNPEGEHVFQFRGRPMDDANGAAFRQAVERAGLPTSVNWHTLRHTFASWAVQGGVSLHELMQLGDWRSYAMVLRYAHLAPDHVAAAARKVATRPKRRRTVAEQGRGTERSA